MNQNVFKKCTKAFALRVINLVESLTNRKTVNVIGRRQFKASRLSDLIKEAGELLVLIEALIKPARVRSSPQLAIRNPN